MKNPYLADSAEEQNPEAQREYAAKDDQRIMYIVESLLQGGTQFFLQRDGERVWITVAGEDPDECNNAFTRAENNAYYWLVEAPGRSSPWNSTDDYN